MAIAASRAASAVTSLRAVLVTVERLVIAERSQPGPGFSVPRANGKHPREPYLAALIAAAALGLVACAHRPSIDRVPPFQQPQPATCALGGTQTLVELEYVARTDAGECGIWAARKWLWITLHMNRQQQEYERNRARWQATSEALDKFGKSLEERSRRNCIRRWQGTGYVHNCR